MPSVPWEVRSAVLGWPWAKPAAVAAVVPNWKMSFGMEETIFGVGWFLKMSGREWNGCYISVPGVEETRLWMSGDVPKWQSAMRMGNSDVDTNLLFENRQCRPVPFVVIYTRDYSTGMHSDVRNAVMWTGAETAEEVAILTINQDHRSNRR